MTSGTCSSFIWSSESKFCSLLPLAISAQEAIVRTFPSDWDANHVCTLPEMVRVMGELRTQSAEEAHRSRRFRRLPFFGYGWPKKRKGSLSSSFLAMALVADLQSGKEEEQQL